MFESFTKAMTVGALVAGGLAVSTPASAVITTFAAFTPVNTTRNVRWVRGTGANATNGSLYTTSSGSANVPGAVNVRFSFLQNYFVANNIAQDITARFTFNGSTVGDPAMQMMGQLIQNIDSGTFSFRSTSAITVGSTTYAAGSNLLSGNFINARLGGQPGGTAGGVEDSGFGTNGSPGSQVSFTSDFLDFAALSSPTVRRDFALALTAINPPLGANPGTAVNNFRASASGNFSSDPAPLINAVPEPAAWAMMIGGFGLIGYGSRRRRGLRAVTA